MSDNLTPKEEFLLNPVEEHNITNVAAASFETNFKHPLKVTALITPIQDLHGMPHPYPAGASVNLIPDGTDTSNGYVANALLTSTGDVESNTSFYVSEYFSIDPNITYTWHDRAAETNSAMAFYDENKVFISTIKNNAAAYHTFTPPEGAVYARSSQTTELFQSLNPNGAAFQLEIGSVATEYQRYSNICSIEGFNGCKFLNDSQYSGEIIWNQYASLQNDLWGHRDTTTTFSDQKIIITTTTGSGIKHTYVNFPVGHKIIVKGIVKKESTVGIVVGMYYPGGTGKEQDTAISKGEEDKSFAFLLRSVVNRTAVTFCFSSSAPKGATVIIDKVQMFDLTEMFGAGNEPATIAEFNELFPHDYYEYNSGEKICISAVNGDPYYSTSITFTDTSTGDPMIIYGGTVTLNEDESVDLVADTAEFTFNGDNAVVSQLDSFEDNNNTSIFDVHLSVEPGHTRKINISNLFRESSTHSYLASVAGEFYTVYKSGSNPNCARTFYGKPNSGTTIEEFKEFARNNPIQYVFSLKTPVIYHFSNIGQLKTFLGTNNVWSDTGNVNVKYLTQHSETGLEYRGDRALELRRRAMIGDIPTIHTTVGSSETNGFASFKAYVKSPIKKIEIPFYPKQDLHGMSSSYPPGTSVNLIPDGTDTNNGYVSGQHLNVDGTTTVSANWYISEYIILDPETTYTWSNRINTTINPSICFYDENKTFISGINMGGQYSHTFTPPEGTVYCRSSQTTYIVQKESNSAAFQLEVGSTATEFQRYSNICPIEGFTKIKIINSGENLWDDNLYHSDESWGLKLITDPNDSFYGYYGGSIKAWANNFEYEKRKYGRIRISADIGNDYPTGVFIFKIYFVYDDGTVSNTSNLSVQTKDHISVLSNPNKTCIGYKINTTALVTNNQGRIKNIDVRIYDEDSEPEYAKPLRTTLPIVVTDLSTGDPITIYGGTITVNEDGSVDVISKIGIFTSNDSTGWTVFGSGGFFYENALNTNILTGTYQAPFRCNKYILATAVPNSSYVASRGDNTYFTQTSYPKRLWIKDTSLDATLESLNSSLSENPLQVTYPLENPITYHFSNLEQFKTFLGENNFQCDISDDITVKYLNRGFNN